MASGASPERKRSASPSKDGFLFKNSGGTEDFERIIKATSGRPRSAAGFEKFPDYSKINAERYNANREDTFNTVGNLKDKNFNTQVRVSKRDLFEICEQSFRRTVSGMTKEIVRDVKDEINESLEFIRKMGSEASEATKTRDTFTNAMLTQIHETVHDAHVSKETLQNEIRSGEMLVLEGQRDLMLRLEGKLMHTLGQVRNELQDVRRAQEVAEDDLREKIRDMARVEKTDQSAMLQQTVEQLAQVANMQKSLNAYVLQNGNQIQKLEVQTQHQIQLWNAFEAQIVKHFQDDDVLTSAQIQVLSQIKRYHVSASSGNATLLSEVGKIQQALNLDFAHVLEDIADLKVHHSDRRESLSLPTSKDAHTELDRLVDELGKQESIPRKRLREYWSQTDGGSRADAWVQTEAPRKKSTRKGKNVAQPKAEKSALTLAADRAKEHSGRSVFADKESMKKNVRQVAVQVQYNVHDLYHTTGYAQTIAKSTLFETVTYFMILFNAIWIAVDLDHNDKDFLLDSSPVFQVAEHTFCAYFTLELLIRFYAFRRKRDCFRDNWFIFDFLLVVLMIAETWILTLVIYLTKVKDANLAGPSLLRIFRFLKLARVSRMARLFQAIPELGILLKGIGTAFRSVSVFLVFWLIIIYVFAILFRQLTDGDHIGDQYFRTVPDAMNTLLLDGILPDASELVHDLARAKPFLWPIIVAFILLASLTLMYMLVGVLVDLVSVIATAEKEGITVMLLASSLRAAMEELGRDPEESISKGDFQNLLLEPSISRIVESADVNVVMVTEMTDMFFEEYAKSSEEISFESLIDLLLQMRGTNPATVKDVKSQLKVIRSIVADSASASLKQIGQEFVRLREELQRQVRKAQNGDWESDCDDDGDDSFEPDGMSKCSDKGSRKNSKISTAPAVMRDEDVYHITLAAPKTDN